MEDIVRKLSDKTVEITKTITEIIDIDSINRQRAALEATRVNAQKIADDASILISEIDSKLSVYKQLGVE